MASAASRDLDVGRLCVLREVGQHGSIAGAARALGITASAVSQQVSLLEREVGTPLVHRQPRGVALTGAGHALAERAGELLDVLDAARADLDRLAGTIAGPVRLAAVPSAAATFVSGALGELRTSHPGIDARVVAAEPDRALGLLLTADVDLAVVDEYDYVPLAVPESAPRTALLAEPLVAVLDSGWSGPRRPALADLAGADWVMPPAGAACGLAVRSACRAAGFEPRVRWETDDMLLLARAVAAGHGVAVLPRMSVPNEVVDVQLRPLAGERLQRNISVLARHAIAARPVVDVVIHALQGQITL